MDVHLYRRTGAAAAAAVGQPTLNRNNIIIIIKSDSLAQETLATSLQHLYHWVGVA